MRRFLARSFITILVLVACRPAATAVPSPLSSGTSSPTLTVPPAPTPFDNSLNLLIVARGPVQLKRDGWPDYQSTAFGAILQRGDMLQLGSGAQATVLCDDLTAWLVPAGAPSGVINGCPPTSKSALVRPEGLIGVTKKPADLLVPYVISPRMTYLMSRQPTLRWNAVVGVTTYTVSIRGDDGFDWSTSTTTTQMVYPADAPSLQPDVNYLLLVQADNGRASREENASGIGFSLLSPEETEPIQADAARLYALALPPEAEAYALAHLYARHNLTAEAVDLLEALADNGSQEAAVYRALGDLYHRIGVERLAEARYLRASELAAKMGDVEGQAISLASLGEVYISLSNKDLALAHWQQALLQYQAIGDVAQADHMQERIDKTK